MSVHERGSPFSHQINSIVKTNGSTNKNFKVQKERGVTTASILMTYFRHCIKSKRKIEGGAVVLMGFCVRNFFVESFVEESKRF